MPSSINLLFLKSDLLPSYKMKKKSNSSKISTHILIWLVGTYLLPSYKMKKKVKFFKNFYTYTHTNMYLPTT